MKLMNNVRRPQTQEPQITFRSFSVIGSLLLAAAFVVSGRAVSAKTVPAEPVPAWSTPASVVPVSSRDARLSTAYGRLPLAFEANRGQTDSQVQFLARGSGSTLFLTPGEVVLSLRRQSARQAEGHHAVLRMRLHGANSQPRMMALDTLSGRSYYVRGQTRLAAPRYGRVRQIGVYPGIDVEYYGNQGQLEYDFLVSPGANPAQIALAWSGAHSAEINTQGDLVLHTEAGPVVQRAPVAYQEINGIRQVVACRYQLRASQSTQQVAFQLGAYDRRRPLIIDPVLAYTSFTGDREGGSGLSIAVDRAGSAYITGVTGSLEFPNASTSSATTAQTDVFVAKLNPEGTDLEYSTSFGGSAGDTGLGIAVDEYGHAFVVGTTKSRNFPVARPFQRASGGGADAFLVKLSPDGEDILFGTFLGGAGEEAATAVAVDEAGNAYVAGATDDASFPARGGAQRVFGGEADAFIAKFNTTGRLVYSSFLGGRGVEECYAVAVDRSGNAVVAGSTSSNNFPTRNAVQAQHARGRGQQPVEDDAFIAKFNATGSSLLFSSYLGGEADDQALDVALDEEGNVYLTGVTASRNFPLRDPLQPRHGGDSDAFLTKLSPRGNTLEYSTFLGGARYDAAASVAVDAAGSVFLTGQTSSTNLPVFNAFQTRNGGNADVFVAQVLSDGQWGFVSYLGGAQADSGAQIALDLYGNAYVTGMTRSSKFPVNAATRRAGALRNSAQGRQNSFVVKITADEAAPISRPPTYAGNPYSPGDSYPPDNSIDNRPPVVVPPVVPYPGSSAGRPSQYDDNEEPRIRITVPRDRDEMNELDEVRGTVTDDPDGRVERVDIEIRRPDGRYWDGRDWTVGRHALSTELYGETWRRTTGLPDRNLGVVGRYQINVYAYDRAGNVGRESVEFEAGDRDPPQVSFQTPRNGETLRSLTEVSGTAFDDRDGSGLARVELFLRDAQGRYWNGKVWVNGERTLLTRLERRREWNRTEGLPRELPEGAYRLEAIAYDNAGNHDRSTITIYGAAAPGPIPPPVPGPGPVPPSPPNPPTPAPPTFSISGRITNDSGQGLANVRISLSNGGSTRTDREGRYQIANLPEAVYRLRPEYQGLTFEPENRLVRLAPDIGDPNVRDINFVGTRSTPEPEPRPAPPPAPQPPPAPEPPPAPSPEPPPPPQGEKFRISGRITTETGVALRNVTVTLSSGATTRTDANGEYSFSVEAGSYTVTPSFPRVTFQPGTQSVNVGPDATGVNFVGKLQ